MATIAKGHKRVDLYRTGPGRHNVVCECGWRGYGRGPNARRVAAGHHEFHKRAVVDCRAIAAANGLTLDRMYERTLAVQP